MQDYYLEDINTVDQLENKNSIANEQKTGIFPKRNTGWPINL